MSRAVVDFALVVTLTVSLVLTAWNVLGWLERRPPMGWLQSVRRKYRRWERRRRERQQVERTIERLIRETRKPTEVR